MAPFCPDVVMLSLPLFASGVAAMFPDAAVTIFRHAGDAPDSVSDRKVLFLRFACAPFPDRELARVAGKAAELRVTAPLDDKLVKKLLTEGDQAAAHGLIANAAPCLPGGSVLLTDVIPASVDWMLHPFIPRRMPTLVFGAGGIGKSKLMQKIAACITTGEDWPAGVEADEPGNVLWSSNEEDPASMLHPAFKLLEADFDRLRVPDCLWHQHTIRDAHKSFGGNLDLVVVDSLNQILESVPGLNFYDPEGAAQVMDSLTRQCREYGTTVVVISHESKKKDATPFGSAYWANKARSAVRVVEGQALVHKSNLVQVGSASLDFAIAPGTVTTHGPDGTDHLETAVVSDWSLRQFLQGAGVAGRITDYLSKAKGPVGRKELCDHLKMGRTAVGAHLGALSETGLIVAIGKGPSTRYSLGTDEFAGVFSKML